MFSQKFKLLLAALVLIASNAVVLCAQAQTTQNTPIAHPALDPFFDDLEERTFKFFWDTANPANGLVPDRYPSPSFASIASVGFGLTAYPIGVERHYVTRQAASERVLVTLQFFHDAPQGKAAHGMAGYHGFFYHFLDMKTGERFDNTELSTVDTSLLLGGILFCQSYFDGDNPTEIKIRALAKDIVERVDWTWSQARPNAIAMGWSPEEGFSSHDWQGYNEAMLTYIFAMGSPTHGLSGDAWKVWSKNYASHWKKIEGQEHLGFPPMFGHQFSHIWIDFRGIQDNFMRQKGIDYFENSRRATFAQQAYAVRNPLSCNGYDKDVWGVSASDGPKNIKVNFKGKPHQFIEYAGRGMSTSWFDDCTISPMAMIASVPFAPEIVIPSTLAMRDRYGKYIYRDMGFADAFNPSFDYPITSPWGKVIPNVGWVARDYIGIDEGPIVAMIQNYRDELIWKTMQKNPVVRTGLVKAGFTGGWLDKK